MGRGESVQVWPLRRPVPKKEFLKEKEVPKEKVEGIPETVWVEVGPVNLSDHLERIWEIFKTFKNHRGDENLVLLAKRKDKEWSSGERERIEFFIARPVGIDEDFLKRKKLLLIPDEEVLKNLKNK